MGRVYFVQTNIEWVKKPEGFSLGFDESNVETDFVKKQY